MAAKKDAKNRSKLAGPVRKRPAKTRQRQGARAESSKMAHMRGARGPVPRVATDDEDEEDEVDQLAPSSDDDLVVDTKGKRPEKCHWPFEVEMPRCRARINVVQSYDLLDRNIDLLESIYGEVAQEYWTCTSFTSEVDGESAMGFIFHEDRTVDYPKRRVDPRHFLHARADRTLRSLDSQPTGSRANAANITARLKRNGVFWVRQQDLAEGKALRIDKDRQRGLDVERERAWALDVVHDAVQEWSPELQAAFKTISGALAVDAHGNYPGTFAQAAGPRPRRYDPVREDVYVPHEARPIDVAPAGGASTSADRTAAPAAAPDPKGKKRAREEDREDTGIDMPGTSRGGRRVRTKTDAAQPGPAGTKRTPDEPAATNAGVRRGARSRKPATKSFRPLVERKAPPKSTKDKA